MAVLVSSTNLVFSEMSCTIIVPETRIMATPGAIIIRQALLDDAAGFPKLMTELGYRATEQFVRADFTLNWPGVKRLGLHYSHFGTPLPLLKRLRGRFSPKNSAFWR